MPFYNNAAWLKASYYAIITTRGALSPTFKLPEQFALLLPSSATPSTASTHSYARIFYFTSRFKPQSRTCTSHLSQIQKSQYMIHRWLFIRLAVAKQPHPLAGSKSNHHTRYYRSTRLRLSILYRSARGSDRRFLCSRNQADCKAQIFVPGY